MKWVLVFLLSSFSVMCLAQNGNYSSITYKRPVWSSSSYVGDLSDWVYFGDGRSTVLEYRSPNSSFSMSAAIRQNDAGDTELESLVGATRIAGKYIKFETGGASGVLYNPNRLEPLILPDDKSFKASLQMLAIGDDWSQGNGVKVGYAWIHLVQPAQIDLTYYTVLASAGFVGAPTWAESAVDPEFQNNLLGGWLEVDSLNSFLQGKSTFFANPNRNGNWIRGLALDMEAVAGFYFSKPSVDLSPILKQAYGLDYKYVDSTGLAWFVSYKLGYNLVYKPFTDKAFGIQFGLEGRVFQVITEIAQNEKVSRKSEALGKIGIGDNSSYQWGPYVRLAMVF